MHGREILGDLDNTRTVLDDILVTSDSFEEHTAHIQAVDGIRAHTAPQEEKDMRRLGGLPRLPHQP